MIMKQRRQLIVNADDYGLTLGVSLGILKAHKHGIVTSTSVIVNSSHSKKSLMWLKAFPQLGVGVHLTLVDCLLPVSQPHHKVSSLLANSKFRGTWKQFTRDWFLSKISKKHVSLEFASQIHFLIDAGFRVSHLDAHQYLHLLPGMQDIIIPLALDFKIPFIRVPRPRSKRPLALCINYFGQKYFNAPPHRDIDFSATLGFEETGRMNRASIINLLTRMEHSSVARNDLTVHPAIFQKHYKHFLDWNKHGPEEIDILCSNQVAKKVAKRFHLTNYAKLAGFHQAV